MAIDSLGLPDIDKTDRLNNRLLAAMPQSAMTLLKPFYQAANSAARFRLFK